MADTRQHHTTKQGGRAKSAALPPFSRLRAANDNHTPQSQRRTAWMLGALILALLALAAFSGF